MKLGILFSGQGAQKAGMGADLYAALPAYRDTIDQASAILGYDLQAVANDETKITQTAYLDWPHRLSACRYHGLW